MEERTYVTPLGTIHYFVNIHDPAKLTLVFLPGLTADHRLFAEQIAFFQGKYNLLTWDAPAHGVSRPFELAFSLADKARYLHEIITKEQITRPLLIGQSMGGYVSQAYMHYYPKTVAGFVSIDSAPLQKQYMAGWELWLLKRMEPVYRWYPWKLLLKSGSMGVAMSQEGRSLMRSFMESYSHEEYSRLAGHGYRILSSAIALDLPYIIDAPAILICGEKDKAGSAKRYNIKWSQKTGLKLFMIPGAGHNANCDAPEEVNDIIRDFINIIGR